MASVTLPEGWKWQTLGGENGLAIVNPRRPRLDRSDDAPTSFLPMQGVDEVEGKIAQLETRLFGEVRSGYTYFEENDVLFAKITPSMQNGKSAIARGLIDGMGFGSTEFHVLRPKHGVLPEWLHLFVRQLSFRREAMQHFRGAVGQQRVPQEFLETHVIPIPHPDDPVRSLATQRRIVARIEALFAELREARWLHEEVVADTGRLMEAVLAEVFDVNESTLPQRWSLRTISEICHVNPRRPRIQRPDDAPTSFVSMSAVDEHIGAIVAMETRPYSEVRRGYTYFEENDVLFAKITPSMQNGKSAIAKGLIDGIGYGTTEFHVLRCFPEVVIPDWVFFFIRQERFRHEAMNHFRGAVGQQRVPAEFLENHLIPVPDDIDKQELIVRRLRAVQSEIAEMQRTQAEEAALLEEMEQAILAQAFRGEL